MSKKHSISALAAGVCILAAACWMVTATFPLAAAPQLVADAPGVSVDVGGAPLMHRPSVAYPEAARAARIEGTVVVHATVDSAGNVTDASVTSGPEELRKTAIQSVFLFHFVRGGSAHQVVITFQLPPEISQPAVKPPASETKLLVMAPPAPVITSQLAQPPAASEAFNAITAQQNALMAQMRDVPPGQDRQAMLPDLLNQMRELAEKRLALQKIRTITTLGLSDQVRSELLANLPVHEGDAPTTENMAKLREAVTQFDEHLRVATAPTASPEEVEVRIIAPGAEPAAMIVVGGKVQEANLTKKVIPAYPPEAKAARIQGHVVLDVVIGKDGSVQEIKLVSSHPLLAPAAMEAVKQWTYKPTLLNGEPVEVKTQVDINFTLAP
jgi:TonB family protein